MVEALLLGRDEGAGEAFFILKGFGVTGLKAVKQLIKTAKDAT